MTLLEDAVRGADEAGKGPRRRRVPRALFPEAEEHRRFRRWRLALVGAAVLGIGGVALGVAASVDGGGSSPVSLSAASFGASVATATSAAQTARISVSVDSGLGRDRCVSRSLTTASGLVDFSRHRLLLERPATACGPLGANPSRTKAEVVGRKVFFYGPRAAGSNRQTFFYAPSDISPRRGAASVWRSLLVPGGTGAAIYSEPIGRPVSPAPWRVLAGLAGEVRVVGHRTIRGVATTEYQGHATLASLIAEYPAIRDDLDGTEGRPTQMVPVASKVRVRVHVWIDAEHRLRRLELSEPDFQAAIPHAKGAWIDGFDIRRTMSVPRHLGRTGGLVKVQLSHVRVIGAAQVVIGLYDFGSVVDIGEPKTSRVTA